MMAALLYDNWGVCIRPDNFTSLETCSDVIVTDNSDLSWSEMTSGQIETDYEHDSYEKGSVEW